VYETKTDKFSTILSKAANDPKLLRVPVAKKEEPVKQKEAETAALKETVHTKAEETKPLERPADSSVAQTTTETAASETPKPEVAASDTVATEAVAKETKMPERPQVQQEEKKEVVDMQATVYKPSVVSRYSESSTTEGFGVIYFDKNETLTDTIRILIPAPRVKLVADTETASGTDAIAKSAEINSGPETKKVESNNTASENTTVAASTNSTNCKNIASDKDFLKLRRKMAAKENNDAMLDEARKEFRTKCYSVEQVRNLSSLFLTSASKYQFFDIAYYNVSDKSNFVSLGTEIKDEHYTRRFKALIGE
jgi:hypothetical protein